MRMRHLYIVQVKGCQEKAQRMLSIILETGNFGNKRDINCIYKNPYLTRMVISFWHSSMEFAKRFMVFLLDSVITWTII